MGGEEVLVTGFEVETCRFGGVERSGFEARPFPTSRGVMGLGFRRLVERAVTTINNDRCFTQYEGKTYSQDQQLHAWCQISSLYQKNEDVFLES